MTQPRTRPRTGQSTPLYARVHPDLHARVKHTAAALDVSVATYIEALLVREQQQLDEHGRPAWWDDSESSQEVLHLHRTA